jgi:hypothetical protein
LLIIPKVALLTTFDPLPVWADRYSLIKVLAMINRNLLATRFAGLASDNVHLFAAMLTSQDGFEPLRLLHD